MAAEAEKRLCHVTTQQALAAGAGVLQAEPFLHCCTEAQLPFVLQRHFAGRTGLLVVRFHIEKVHGSVRWEQSEPGMPPFPHLYGRLPLDAAEISPAPG